MAGLCKVIIIGNLGRDPEKRFTQAGGPITRFSVAASSRRKVEGEWQDHTEWFNVTVFGRQAETLAERLAKGNRVYVEGRLESRTYEANGQTRVALDVVANEVLLLESRARGEEFGGESASEAGGSDRAPVPIRPGATEPEDLEDLPF